MAVVLVVEDDLALRTLMVAWLRAEGYDVRTAGNGREALERLREEAPSLMVVDLDMPVMNGAELRRQQLQMPGRWAIPFILVSAADNAARVAHSLGIDVLAKPCDSEQLLRMVGSRCHRAL